MERAAAELFLASLFVEATPERHEALRNAAKAARNWDGLLPALHAHGVLGLFLRNLGQAGIELPSAAAPQFEAKNGAQRDEDQRARLTLQRFLAAATRAGVEVTLVGPSAAFLELYDEPVRRAGGLEVLVPPEHLARALRAGADAGLLPEPSALPAWWYLRTESALPLAPTSGFLAGLCVRTRLHHPSLLLALNEPELLARRRKQPFEGFPLHRLQPIDALLELAVTLATRAGDTLIHGRSKLLGAAASPGHALRLDLLLDVHTQLERAHAELAPAAVLARAREWGAEPALHAVLECLQMGVGFAPAARELVRRLAQGLAGAAGAGRSSASPLFRPDPIERLPHWLRPSEAFLARRYALAGTSSPRALRLARARHLFGVLAAGAVAGLGYPVALAARQLARKARAAAWASAQTPQRLSDVSESYRSAARVEREKPALPRTIRLPSEEERVARFPDRYLG
jgi:hypothetical protein